MVGASIRSYDFDISQLDRFTIWEIHDGSNTPTRLGHPDRKTAFDTVPFGRTVPTTDPRTELFVPPYEAGQPNGSTPTAFVTSTRLEAPMSPPAAGQGRYRPRRPSSGA